MLRSPYLLIILSALLFCNLVFCNLDRLSGQTWKLEYQPAPADNPMKGLVPYSGITEIEFPHSLEFNYLPFSDLVKGYDEFDWTKMEELLNDISSRGNQAVVRVFLEYPGKKNVIPEFLIRDGLTIHKYLNTNTQPFPPTEVETPDYGNAKLRMAMTNFIAAWGKKYDGDPRLGYITAGLLGTWGEWHTYPKDELFASKEVQIEVMDAFEKSFKVTPVLMRYPAGPKTWGKAENATRKFGYHDDSFAWATLDTKREEDNWFFLPAMKEAGSKAVDKWKIAPIGGEIRPEAWGKVFDPNPGDPQIQNFRKCVEQTHATWLMDTGMYQGKKNPARVERAIVEVQRMGYEFYIAQASLETVGKSKYELELIVENRGVAPFYFDWPIEVGIVEKGEVVASTKTAVAISKILPTQKGVTRKVPFELDAPMSGKTLAIRIANPLSNGKPLRFANKTQDADVESWLTLGICP